MKKVYGFIFALHAFVGLGGIAGGMAAILNPEAPMGAPVDMLKNSPFSNFLIPGIILFAVIGVGNVVSAAVIPFKWKFQGYLSSIFSWALVIWIVVQCIMINAIAALHIIFFIVGLVEAALSMIILFKEKLFPANIVINIIGK